MFCTQKQKTFYGSLEIDSMNTPTKLVFNRPKGSLLDDTSTITDTKYKIHHLVIACYYLEILF
jgi:hypothetical protein